MSLPSDFIPTYLIPMQFFEFSSYSWQRIAAFPLKPFISQWLKHYILANVMINLESMRGKEVVFFGINHHFWFKICFFFFLPKLGVRVEVSDRPNPKEMACSQQSIGRPRLNFPALYMSGSCNFHWFSGFLKIENTMKQYQFFLVTFFREHF